MLPATRSDVDQLQDALIAFVRAFGLLRPIETPCGRAMSVSEAHALGELSVHGSMTQQQLSRRLRLQKSTVSRLVDQLVARGWARRSQSQVDGRAVEVALTEAGQVEARQLAMARRDKFAGLLQAVPADQRSAVLNALHTLTEALDD